MTRTAKIAALAALLLVGACGASVERPEDLPPAGDTGDDDVGDETPTDDDDNDYGPAKCIQQDVDPVGELTTVMDFSYYLESLSKWSISTNLQGDFSLRISLNTGVGSLAGGVVPGAYPITGDDTRAEDCALCVSIYGTNADGDIVRFFAKGGTLEITEADEDGDIIHGRLTEVALVPYDTTHIIGPACTDHEQCGNNTCNTTMGRCYVTVPLPNQCETSIGSMEF